MTVSEDTEQLTQVRVQIGRMEGKLDAFIESHQGGLSSALVTLSQHEERLDNKSKAIATLQEKVSNLEASNNGRISRVALIISSIVGLLALFNTVRIPMP